MALLFQDAELMELMQDFYVLTGMRIALFDASYAELISYPTGKETFCACMREHPSFDHKCRESDRLSFEQCKKTRSLHIYPCHAGLKEATVPIVEGERVIGYMMFGQITDQKNKEELFLRMTELCAEYGVEEDLGSRIKKIKYRNERQIRAAAKIMDACTEYVRLKEIVQPSGKQLIDAIDHYVQEHLREELDVSRICREFHISRTRLYETIRPYVKGGLAAYIKDKRLEYAKTLLKTTDLPIAEVAYAAGFSDYNYFLRVFKQKYGVPSKRIRQKALLKKLAEEEKNEEI